MSDFEIIADQIEKYCEAHTTPESSLFRALARETYEKMEWPGMQVGHLEGGFLRMVTRMLRPMRVLEIGTFTGYSALAMAEGMPEGGAIITCDIDPKATAIARETWMRSPHGAKITLKLGPALDTIRELSGPFDLVFIDADKENYIHYWEACVPKVRHGGMVLADNVLWSGKVLNPREASDHAIVAFNDHVMKDPRTEQVMLTVRDGILACWKK